MNSTAVAEQQRVDDADEHQQLRALDGAFLKEILESVQATAMSVSPMPGLAWR